MGVEERITYRLTTGGKECHGCQETKPVTAYATDHRSKDGLGKLCIVCRATITVAVYEDKA